MPIKGANGTTYHHHGIELDIDESYELEPNQFELQRGVVKFWIHICICKDPFCREPRYYKQEVTRMGAKDINPVKNGKELKSIKLRLSATGLSPDRMNWVKGCCPITFREIQYTVR